MGQEGYGCLPIFIHSISCGLFLHLVVTIILSSAGLSLSQELVTGRLNASDASPSPGGLDLPDLFNLDLTLNGSDLHLELGKDPDFVPDVPVYVLDSDNLGKTQIHRASLLNQQYAVYHDLKNEASFGVVLEKDGSGNTRYSLEGVVHSEGKTYDVKTSPTPSSSSLRQPQQQQLLRRRRSSTDNSTDDVGYDTRRNGREEEFEVHVHPASSAFGSDSIPRPPLIQVRREMQNARQVQVVGAVPHVTLPIQPPSPPDSPSHRRRRAVTQDIYVDVVALADYGVYKTWLDRSNGSTATEKQQNAIQSIRKYYAFIFNGVNILYKSVTSLPYKINARLSSIVIAATPQVSTWTEQFRVTAPQWDEVNANSALKAVSDWAATSDILPAYDHLMLFSGYDLTKTANGVTSDKITGLAYTGTVCDTNGKATSIVEDLGGFQCIGTAAHELGHGLSAEHDGTENLCASEDRYIMAAGTYDVTSTNKYNPWRFSSCSVNYFNTFFNNEVNTALGRQCLYNPLTVNSVIPDVTSQVEGQLYDPDAQCRQVYGSNSRLCRGPEFGSSTDVCTDMFCFDPTTSATCYQLVAARGTTCGNKKWCSSGQCVYDSAAPSVDESCVFGDQPGIAFDGMSCTQFVTNFPGYCYQDVVKQRCCRSCSQHYNPVQNCEYGDKATGCSSNSCSFASTQYKQSCCGSCNYGTPIPTTTTSTTTRTTTLSPPTTMSPGVGVTTTTPTTTTTTPGGVCVDNTTVTINQMDCRTVATTRPDLCYDSRVLDLCCQSCRSRNTGVTGCEFGDRRPDECATVQTDRDTCSILQPVCCKSCQGYTSPTGGQATPLISTTLLLLSLSITALFLGQSIH